MDVDGYKIILPAVGQHHLHQTGPMVPASWYITPEREEQLRMLGGTLPKKVDGFMLLDTGAQNVSIDSEVAQELKLKSHGTTGEVHGFGGPSITSLYAARLILSMVPIKNGKAISGPVPIGMPIADVWESKGIQADHIRKGHITPDGKPLKVIGVIGRLILQFAKINYDGLTGAVEIFIDKSIGVDRPG